MSGRSRRRRLSKGRVTPGQRVDSVPRPSWPAPERAIRSGIGHDVRAYDMTISANRAWFDDETMWVGLTDDRVIGVPLTWFPRLLTATPAQRARFQISASGQGLHWEELDEDISIAGLLRGRGDQTVKHWIAA